ncbi:site-specific integrase [Empedobacter falsenii]
MRQIEFTLVYNRKKSLNKNGEALIQVCCYRMGVRKYFSTGIYIKPEEWNDRKQIVNHYREDYEELNERLEQKLLDLKTKIKLIKEKGETATLRKLKEVKDEKIYTSFYDFMEDQIEKRNLNEATKKTQRRTLSVLKEFKKELGFKDIDVVFLMNFQRFIEMKGLKTNSVYKYFKNIRTYVNLAIVMDLMDNNDYPFKKFKLKQVDGNRDFLTPDELKKFEKLDFSSDKILEKVKDIFLFSCYTGLRFSDIIRLEKHFFISIDGIIWLDTDLLKSQINNDITTRKNIKLPLSKLFKGKAVEIFEKYKNDKKYLFDDFSNNQMNENLRIINAKLNLDKVLM